MTENPMIIYPKSGYRISWAAQTDGPFALTASLCYTRPMTYECAVDDCNNQATFDSLICASCDQSFARTNSIRMIDYHLSKLRDSRGLSEEDANEIRELFYAKVGR